MPGQPPALLEGKEAVVAAVDQERPGLDGCEDPAYIDQYGALPVRSGCGGRTAEALDTGERAPPCGIVGAGRREQIDPCRRRAVAPIALERSQRGLDVLG